MKADTKVSTAKSDISRTIAEDVSRDLILIKS